MTEFTAIILVQQLDELSYEFATRIQVKCNEALRLSDYNKTVISSMTVAFTSDSNGMQTANITFLEIKNGKGDQ